MKAIKQGFLDFDIYDLYFAGRHLPNLQRDSDIVIVEIGANRSDIAGQLNILKKYSPAVIGIDADFDQQGEPADNLMLEEAIRQLGNKVCLGYAASSGNPAVPSSKPIYNQQVNSGYINYSDKDSFSVIREYKPFIRLNRSEYPAFTSAIIAKYDPEKFRQLKKRKNKNEVINYTGNLESYTNLSADEFVNADTTGQLETIVGGKIVLLGYFVKNAPPVIEDLFFSPVNPHVSGKSFPDMYGVAIHANILTMLLHEDYITQASGFMSYLFAAMLIFLFLLYMLHQYREKGHPKHGKFLLIQFLLILLMLYVFLQVFNLLQVKVPLLPVMIALVLSLELLGVYKNIALWMHKKYQYKTVFAHKHII
jgi:CHASE2 domain-containing sensor protein